LNRAPEAQAPYVGASAFATKAGIHASALAKEPATYEHVAPEAVGNRRRVMVSDQGGKANFLAELRRRGIDMPRDDHRLDALISVVKEREAEGYAYEGADASFELLARKMLHGLPEFFNVTSFRCMVERRFDANGQLKTVSEAIVKVVVDGEEKMSVAEGHGPVNALDIALRKDLGKFQGEIADLELADFKVRILNGGTEAITRVLIESHDGTGARWWTVGVSENIIDASFQALPSRGDGAEKRGAVRSLRISGETCVRSVLSGDSEDVIQERGGGVELCRLGHAELLKPPAYALENLQHRRPPGFAEKLSAHPRMGINRFKHAKRDGADCLVRLRTPYYPGHDTSDDVVGGRREQVAFVGDMPVDRAASRRQVSR
jgi:hypothetical protein